MAAGGEAGCRLVSDEAFIKELVDIRQLDRGPGLGSPGFDRRGPALETEVAKGSATGSGRPG